MRKTWTAPTLQDFNMASRKRAKPDSDPPFDPAIPRPESAEELAVHPRKVAEVRNWMRSCVRRPPSMLLICGPPGCGKTLTFELIAESEGFLLAEWIGPVSKTVAANVLEENGVDSSGFFDASEGTKFEQFVTRTSRYPSLFQPEKPTLILVKDFPNAFIWRPELFHGFLERYKSCGKCPMAFVVTDDENLDLHGSLFPAEIKKRLAVDVIKFNPVCDTILKKNLKNLSSNLSAQFLERIVRNSAGDFRSAATDILLELRTGKSGGLPQGSKRRKRTLHRAQDETEPDSKPAPTRDHGYDFYKRMGRILYPKRAEGEESQTGRFVHSFLEIAENWSPSYSAFLHENYLKTFSQLGDAAAAADFFSFCDVLPRDREANNYSGLVIVAGLMMANTQPKRSGFLPFKKSVNLNRSNDWKCKFGEEEALKFGVEERIFALDVAPLKHWLPIEIDSSVRTLTSSCETLGKFKSSQTDSVRAKNVFETKKVKSQIMDTSEEEDEDVYEIED